MSTHVEVMDGSSTSARFSRGAILLFAAHILLLCILAYVHTVWRDESNVWLMARDSSSFRGMLRPIRYDGHPPLWDLLVFLTSRLTQDLSGLKYLTLLLSSALSAVIFFSGRLALWKRAGIAFSYLFLFEYGTMERNYLPGLVCLLLAAEWLLGRSPRLRYHSIWLICLAALFSTPTLLLALVLVCLWLYRGDMSAGSERRWTWKWPELSSGTIVGLAALLATLVLVAWVVHPPADSNLFVSNVTLEQSIGSRLFRSGAYFLKGMVAVPSLSVRFWDSTIWSMDPLWKISTYLGWGLFLVIAAYYSRAAARVYFLCSSALLLALLLGSGRAFERHVGFFFVAFVVALLIEGNSAEPENNVLRGSPGWRQVTVAAVLAFQVVGGCLAAWQTTHHPFSAARQVADFLRHEQLAQAPLLIDPIEDGTSVLAYLHRRSAYSVEFRRETSYIIWNRQEMQHRLPTDQEMRMLSAGSGERPVLLMETPLTEVDASHLGVHLLATFNDGVCSYENYYLYR